jgi:hypothetical protein
MLEKSRSNKMLPSSSRLTPSDRGDVPHLRAGLGQSWSVAAPGDEVETDPFCFDQYFIERYQRRETTFEFDLRAR